MSYCFSALQGAGIFQLLTYTGSGAQATDYRGLVH